MTSHSLIVDPIISSWILYPAIILLLIPISILILYRVRGSLLRLVALFLLVFILLRPSLSLEHYNKLPDIALVLVDESASQKLGKRPEQSAHALANLKASASEDLEIVVERYHDKGNGTQLIQALLQAASSLPPDRRAGIVILSDGIIHDMPPVSAKQNSDTPTQESDRIAELVQHIGAPIHLLLTGSAAESDRRLQVDQAPAYGIVGKSVILQIRVQDTGFAERAESKIDIAVTIQGQSTEKYSALTGESIDIPISITRAGNIVIEIEAPARPGELTLANNRHVISLTGVHERLSVLLISGAPNPLSRAWRDLLKSDPMVDLVHFTILRSINHGDLTPAHELALIPFPIQEIFYDKISNFDLIILDRFRPLKIMPLSYLRNLIEHVQNGGTLLVTTGAEYTDTDSLFFTPLNAALLARPLGKALETRFVPRLTPLGKRHPITSQLTAGNPDHPSWGHWHRIIPTYQRGGNTLLVGESDYPLLIVGDLGKGRVAQLLSDQLWLWARGYDGGGPANELLRRLAHWLMRAPELEPNRLQAIADRQGLTVIRHGLLPSERPVDVVTPSEKQISLPLSTDKDGRERGFLTTDEIGVYHIIDPDGPPEAREAFVSIGDQEIYELNQPLRDAKRLLPLIKESGGGLMSLEMVKDVTIRHGEQHSPYAGEGWLGFKRNHAVTMIKVEEVPLLPPWLALAITLGTFVLLWWREGGRNLAMLSQMKRNKVMKS